VPRAAGVRAGPRGPGENHGVAHAWTVNV
jgi:hypothetical protein